jgi:sensor histidine kinase YesM
MLKLLTFLWILMPCFLFSEQPSYINYTTADGLPSNTVFCSMQDSKGYIWFGTDKGVAKFDGVKFTVFTTSDGMADNIVFDIYEDSKHRIWFSCNNGNVCYYSNNKFSNKNSDKILSKLTATSLGLKVIEDKFENVFLLSQFHLFKLTNQNVCSEIKVKELKMYSSLVLNNLGEVIALSSEGYYNTNTNKTFVFPEEMKNKPLLYTKALYYKSHIYYNHNNRFSYFNPSIPNSFVFSISITDHPNMSQCVYIKNDSTALVGTQGGLITLNLKTNKMENKSFHGFSISSFTRDFENNFWMTTLTNGVILSVNSKVKILNENSGLIFNYAGFIDKLSDGNIAIGSNKYLASIIENGQIHNLRLPKEAGEGKIEKIRIGNNGVYYLTAGAVTIKVDKSDWSAKVLAISTRDINIISPSKSIMILGNGILTLNSSNFEDLYIKKYYIKYPNIGHTIENVKASGIYSSIYTNKIYVYGLLGAKLLNEKHLVPILNNHEYLAKNITKIAETKDSMLCFSSNIYGVIIVYKDKIFTINKNNGLQTNFVNSLYVDKGNHIWAATSEGLSKIDYRIQNDKVNFMVKSYSQSDGLNAKSFNDLVIDGQTIYATSDHGVCIFKEKDLSHNTSKPIVHIESIYIGKKKQPISKTYTITYPSNSLRIEFIGLSYSSFGKITYKYRMKGLENSWQYTQNNILEYPALPHGEFDFELIALNSKNIESAIQSIHIIVNPPFWRTWWFYTIIFCLSVFLVYQFIRWRLSSMRKSHNTMQQILEFEKRNMEAEKKQAEYEKEIIDIQNQALRLHMNPHFIFNSINSIQGFYASGDVSMAKKYIGKFSTLLRMILDQSKKDLIDINDELKTIEYYLDLNKLRFENKFEFDIQVDKVLLNEREEIPPMLIQPFIENSIIHGIAPLKKMGKVIVRILNDGDYILCEIEDNGVGREYSKKLNTIKNYESTGIKVTEKRINLYNETLKSAMPSNLTIIDIQDENGKISGTKVSFRLVKNSL